MNNKSKWYINKKKAVTTTTVARLGASDESSAAFNSCARLMAEAPALRYALSRRARAWSSSCSSSWTRDCSAVASSRASYEVTGW